MKILIDEAINLCGSGAELARRLGVERSEVSQWRLGHRPVSPMTVGLLCHLLNLRPEEAQRLAALAVVEAAPPDKASVLRRVFFASTQIGVAVCFALVTCWTGGAQAEGVKTTADVVNSLYIVHSLKRALGAMGASLRAWAIASLRCLLLPLQLRELAERF